MGKKLHTSHAMLVTAESCTGGWVAQAVTSVAGSSDWFERGYVTYSNAAKREALGVRETTLARYGAVSEETAREMARGALKMSRGALRPNRRAIALSVTGIAGPGGGAPGKPVGTVCFAWAQGRKLASETKRFRGGRNKVRRQSVIHALRGLLKWL
ncbi:MAG: nicotinamide-nucleotide amidohydrolase family protein [Betaproteobacteria bacterium]|nr:nicotinamide-nucleotide amidohydrolase family protein [Betaproteobacteria bacterium]